MRDGVCSPNEGESLNESDGESHLRVTLPPASSISALAFSASSFFAAYPVGAFYALARF